MIVSLWIVFTGISLLLFFDLIQKVACSFSADRGEEMSYRLADRIVRTMFSLFRRLGGFRFDYEKIAPGTLPPRFLVIANHQSLLDIPVVMDFFGSCRKVRFVAKRELGRFFPLVSSVLRLQGHALISREGNVHQAMDALARFAGSCARRKVHPVIFPEGTRSKNGSVGAFHTAGVRRILEEGGDLPIVALAMDGGWRVRNVRNMLRNLEKGLYRVRLVGVYPAPAGKKDILDVVSRARTEISAIVEEWHRGKDGFTA